MGKSPTQRGGSVAAVPNTKSNVFVRPLGRSKSVKFYDNENLTRTFTQHLNINTTSSEYAFNEKQTTGILNMILKKQ